MDENTPTAAAEVTTPTDSPPPKSRPVRAFFASRPRLARALTLTGAGAALVLGTRAVTNAQHNKDKLGEAVDHTKAAAEDFSDSVVIHDQEA